MMTNINVVQLPFSDDIYFRICEFENESFKKYFDYIEPYRSMFEAYGCEIVVGLEWHNLRSKEFARERIEMKRGYECVVYVLISKDGVELTVPSNDGEVDYYRMLHTYTISQIKRRLFKSNAYLYLNIDNEIDEDMNIFLEQVKCYYKSDSKI